MTGIAIFKVIVNILLDITNCTFLYVFDSPGICSFTQFLHYLLLPTIEFKNLILFTFRSHNLTFHFSFVVFSDNFHSHNET